MVSALPELKVHIPPKRPHCEFWSRSEHNPSIGTSPVASVPSGDIRNFRYRKALQRAKTVPLNETPEISSSAQTASPLPKRRPPSQQLSCPKSNIQDYDGGSKGVADMDLMLGSMILELDHDVASRQLKFLQDGIERIYSRKAAPKREPRESRLRISTKRRVRRRLRRRWTRRKARRSQTQSGRNADAAIQIDLKADLHAR